MEQKNLYPPIYKETDTAERQTVQVTLRNEARQPEWKLVHDALVKQKTLKNADVRQILNIENTVRTSKLLKAWVNAGLIEIANPEAGTRIREYRLASAEDTTTITNWLRDGGAAEVAGAIQQLISSYKSLNKNKNGKEPEEPELLPKS